jgi:hypothetical protein
MSRIFDNPNNLPKQTVCERLMSQDALSVIDIYDTNAILSDGSSYRVFHCIKVDSILSDDAITAILAIPQTAQEINDLTDYINARSSFQNLPNWSTWTSQQASDYVTNNILSGMTQAQVDNYITTTATNLAGVNTVLHQIGTALINIRTIYEPFLRQWLRRSSSSAT